MSRQAPPRCPCLRSDWPIAYYGPTTGYLLRMRTFCHRGAANASPRQTPKPSDGAKIAVNARGQLQYSVVSTSTSPYLTAPRTLQAPILVRDVTCYQGASYFLTVIAQSDCKGLATSSETKSPAQHQMPTCTLTLPYARIRNSTPIAALPSVLRGSPSHCQ